MKIRSLILKFLLPVIGILPLLVGCYATGIQTAIDMFPHVVSAINAVEEANITASVSHGVTKEKLSQIKKVSFLFGGDASEDEQPSSNPSRSSTMDVVMQDNLIIEMMGLGFECIERRSLKRVLDEQGIQISGAVDVDNAVKAGKIIGVQAIIMGAVLEATQNRHGGFLGNETKTSSLIQSATFKIVDVETANTLMVVAINYKHGQRPDIAAKSMAGIIKIKLETPDAKVTKEKFTELTAHKTEKNNSTLTK